MSCTFWMRRKRIAARIREERLKAEQEQAKVEAETKVTEPEKPKKAGGKNGKSDKRTDTES